MDPFGRPDPPPAAASGWYPDPAGSGSLRFWDGTRWTEAISSAVPPAGPHNARDDTRSWALAAHLSALLSLALGVPFAGPLAVYVARKDDPFVRRHAAEALNFNLSVMLYAIVLGAVTLVLALFAVAGLALIAVPVLGLLAWFGLVCLAALRAGQGDEHRYPLTIRFVH